MSISDRFLSLEDLTHLPRPSWMIESLFERASLTMLFGPSGSFKSFLLIDWLCCMASGRRWMGRPTQLSKVVYALGEGKSSLIKRIQAWTTYNRLSPIETQLLNDNFRVTFEVPQLASKASTDNFLADLTKEGFQPDVVAIDTFARSMVGMDENDAKDTGLWIESADRLRQLGLTVLFLHHSKRNTELGVQFRGSSAIIGAMDTSLALTRDSNYATLKVTKQKDHDEGLPLRFRAINVPLGEPGDESCVLVPTIEIMDDRFAPSAPDVKIEPAPPEVTVVRGTQLDLITAIANDARFQSDNSRAKEIARLLKMSTSTAQRRLREVRETVGQTC